MIIQLNGTEREVPDGVTVATLLRDLKVDPAHVAVEIDMKILTRDQYPDTALSEGATVEVIQFIGGG